ncbi:EAL domain-containing protein [Thalassotalea sp. LPB0316]|uniref:bifunctional diguanylate cyclase/phosphodiesterase n=1 Tax=Thalassotalea sp. LPB0316 TaxID=2769490 RepID=UPI001866BDD0|nr:EAL domain-containing protein [Thalassotalea sp. LPB0316]QOL25229.1 EAL domain-containing protein [Thalassotalea sp. LPB0316]
MKIKYKLFYIPGLLIILFLLIIHWVVFNQVRDNIETSLLSSQRILLDSTTSSIYEFIDQYVDLVTYLQTFDTVKDTSEYKNISAHYKGLSDQQGINVRSLFKQTLKTYPEFAYFATYTKENAINVIYEPYNEQLKLTEDSYHKGFSYRDWYSGAMNQRATYVSEAYMSASILQPVVAISTPIFVKEDIVGIMIGSLKLTTLSNFLAELNFGQTGHAYIIDKNNQIVAHPDPKYFKDNQLFSLNDSDILNTIRQSAGFELQPGLLKAYDPLTNSEVYFAFNKLDDTGWTVITQMSVEEVDKPIKKMYQTIFLPSMIIAPLLLFALFLIVRRVVQRIELLSKISENIDDDSLEIDDNEMRSLQNLQGGNDETLKLLDSFESMLERLRHSFNNVDFLANHDQLTALPNRRSFHFEVKKFIDSGNSGAIVILDIDNFKIINDTKGHAFGDKVLVEIASLLRTKNNDRFYFSRFGGDEFLACIKVQGENAIEAAIAELHEAITTVIDIDGIEIDINCSMGVSLFPEHQTNIDELIKTADLALFEAKESGKKRYAYYNSTLKSRIIEEVDIENSIKDALNNDGFKLVYQPQVNIKTGELIAFEALIRMKNGVYHPGQFIPVAEKYGHISDIGRWTLLESIKQLSQWQNDGLPVHPISVNYSAGQFVDKDFISFVKQTLSHYRVSEKYLELEITEGLFIKPMADVNQLLNDLSAMGIKLSIDDFGTGYSSISYLMSLPVNKVKLDRSLCVNYLNDKDSPVVESMIQLIKSFDMVVLAEGVEEKSDVDMLVKLDCDIIQGYYFDKPLDADDARVRLTSDYRKMIP